jgi:adenylate kinase family enzyme
MDEGLALWLLIGLIGCGKTTFSRKIWEKNPVGTLRICLDEIIQMMSFYAYDHKLTAFYGEAERVPIVKGLVNRKSVIVDRTNLVKSTREYMINIGRRVRETAHDLLQFLGRSESDLFGRKSESEIALLLLQHVRDRLDRSPTPHEQIINEAFLGLVERRSFFDRELDLFPDRITRENVKSHLERVADLRIHAVLFDVPAEICLDRRLNDPKNVFRNQVRDVDWSDVMKKMKMQMEPPEQSEGFDRIFVVDENGDIKEEF